MLYEVITVTNPIDFETMELNPLASIIIFPKNFATPSGVFAITPKISPSSFLTISFTFVFTKISAPFFSASEAKNLYVFLTSKTAA